MSNSCFLCNQICANEIALCHHCQSSLPLVRDSSSGIANNISVNQPLWDKTYTFYEYKNSMQLLIRAFKFNHNFVAGKILRYLFYVQLKPYLLQNKYDAIISMPIHRKRNFRRGFNQSLYFAKYISQSSGIPIDMDCVKRIKNTQYQNKLSLSERKENIKNAFKVKNSSIYDSVLIIDDVITTGYSLNELAMTLKKTGVKHITISTLSMRLKGD